MTIENIIELVIQNVSGGRNTSDIRVDRLDLRQQIDAIAPKLYAQDFYERWKGAQMLGDTNYVADSNTCTLREFTVIGSCDQYVELDPRPLSLIKNKGIRAVYTSGQERQLTRLNSRNEAADIEDILGDAWWHVRQPNDRLRFLKNPGETVWVEYVPVTEDLLETDELPMPSGMEADLVQALIAYALSERQAPVDEIPNRVDEKK